MRHARVRRKVTGTAERPRLAVFRSLKQVYAQVIDDTRGVTLTAASSIEPAIKGRENGRTKTETSGLVGSLIAERARDKGVTTVTFDRAGYKYHGRVKSLAEAARKGGLEF
jgi:large subunit ribosomal protein L18